MYINVYLSDKFKHSISGGEKELPFFNTFCIYRFKITRLQMQELNTINSQLLKALKEMGRNKHFFPNGAHFKVIYLI